MRRVVSLCVVLLLGAACTPVGGAPTPSQSPSTPPGAGSSTAWLAAGSPELVPVAVSSELAVGPNRFLLNLVDQHNEPLASADRPVTLDFYDFGGASASLRSSVDGVFLPTIPQLPGLYRATVGFDHAGEWGVEVTATEADGSQRSGRLVFDVREASSTPAIGADAIASATPTADSAAGIAAISTDDDPDPDFYTTSVADALAAHEPFLLIFSTPAFCRTATCGPALDIVKSVAPEFKDRITFIHVEPYQLEQADGALRPVVQDDQLVPVPAVVEWGLLTEPFIFVVGAGGKVSAKLEGVASAEEIRGALEEVAR
ncbi:MAG TPA: hypothetical protein VH741_01855 [Candidatus Limnocylindrales bacterium]